MLYIGHRGEGRANQSNRSDPALLLFQILIEIVEIDSSNPNVEIR